MSATRREFLRDAALAGMTAMVASRFGSLAAAQADPALASWGDSLAAARVSYQNLRTVLS